MAICAHLVAQEPYDVTPLAPVGETAQPVSDWIQAGVGRGEPLTQVRFQGDEVSRTRVWEGLAWQERVLVGCSSSLCPETRRQHREERLDKAQATLLALTPPVGRGKRQISEEAALAKHRVGECFPTPFPARASTMSRSSGADGAPSAGERAGALSDHGGRAQRGCVLLVEQQAL
ncbi:MAG TPA: hypothetical protein VGF67_02230 [Ktedonobacteraceae bacterium]